MARIEAGIVDAISEAPRGPYRLWIRYTGTRRLLEPYGILLGARRYLVARQPDKDARLRHFRLDRIEEATATDEWFARDAGFSLADHAGRAFGSYHDDSEYGAVIWRFAPEAAERAAGLRFHPRQVLEPQEDGSLIVRFKVAGWLEMAWHLYQWGDKVEVIAPEPLRRMVEGHRRSDFGAMP